MKLKEKLSIQDKSIILKWIVIVMCVSVLLIGGSLFAYKQIISTEWYHQQMLKKAFRQELVHVNDADQIIFVAISPEGRDDSWQYFYDAPDALFDDMTCNNFEEIDDPAMVEEILTYDWIMVTFKDASKSIYFISPEDEIYWGTSFTVECPSLLKWYKENKVVAVE